MAAAGEAKSEESEDAGLDCPICLQTAVHPVELPCGHIFCYLCIKGVSNQRSGGRCAICRATFPYSVLLNPKLKDETHLELKSSCNNIQWFYEARGGGWWIYDERTMVEVEAAYEAGQRTCKLLIAGHIYEIDFIRMVQFRSSNPAWSRRIKRDQTNLDDTRGVAGIRLQRDGKGSSTVQNQSQTQPPSLPQSTSRSRPARSSATASTSTSTVPYVGLPPQPDEDHPSVQLQVVTENDHDQIAVNTSSGTPSTLRVTSRSSRISRLRASSRTGIRSPDGIGSLNSHSTGTSSNGSPGNINNQTTSSGSDVTSIRITSSPQGSPLSTMSSSASRRCLLIGPSVQLTFDTDAMDNSNDIL